MSGAVFSYPPSGNFSDVAPSGLVNIFDTLEVTYTSAWDALNLTLFCLANDVPSDYQVWQVPTNPLPAVGSYRLESIYAVGFSIYKFPTWCSFKLTNHGDNDIARGGENFQVVSIPGTSTTYRSTVTATATSSPAPTLTSATSATQTPSVASTSTSSTTPQTATSSYLSSSSLSSSASLTASSISFTTSEHPPSSTFSSTSSTSPTIVSKPIGQEAGLSTGAKAGVCIGVGLVLLIIATLCFMVFRLRRKINRTGQVQEDVQKLRSELPIYSTSQDYKSPYVYTSHELEQTSRVELPIQERESAPIELQGSRWLR